MTSQHTVVFRLAHEPDSVAETEFLETAHVTPSGRGVSRRLVSL